MLAILVTLAVFASSQGQQTMNFNYQPAGYQWYRTSGFRPGNRMTGFGNNIQRGFANPYPQQLPITMGNRGNSGGGGMARCTVYAYATVDANGYAVGPGRARPRGLHRSISKK